MGTTEGGGGGGGEGGGVSVSPPTYGVILHVLSVICYIEQYGGETCTDPTGTFLQQLLQYSSTPKDGVKHREKSRNIPETHGTIWLNQSRPSTHVPRHLANRFSTCSKAQQRGEGHIPGTFLCRNKWCYVKNSSQHTSTSNSSQ